MKVTYGNLARLKLSLTREVITDATKLVKCQFMLHQLLSRDVKTKPIEFPSSNKNMLTEHFLQTEIETMVQERIKMNFSSNSN